MPNQPRKRLQHFASSGGKSDESDPENPKPAPPVEIPPDDPNKPADRPDPPPIEEPSPPKPGRWTEPQSGEPIYISYLF